MTLAAIGEIFDVNGERVRAIVNASIKKLQTYREGGSAREASGC
jgi:DNA-directed RNA polymerase sigma subunit (sigma70/sigma32)